MQLSELTLRRELCRRSYYDFFREFWDQIEPEKLAENWHVRYLCDELQQIGEQIFLRTDEKTGESYREPLRHNLIVNISPGESKSSICTIFFPVWLWVNDPTIRVITVSYSDSLSRNHAQKSRDIIDSPKFQETFGHLFQLRKRDQNKKTEYGIVTPNGVSGGVRFATSVGASITGKHAHAIIIDDPLNPKQSKSDAERETANEWLTSTLNSRKVNESITPTILVMQRVHEDDPTAKLGKTWKKRGTLRHIRLPADDRYEIQPPEMVENYTEQDGLRVMNPLRKPAPVIRTNEEAMTAEDFSGQYGQDPQPAEGNILKKDWFTQRFSLADIERRESITGQGPVWNATLDGAYTKQKKNSATAVLIWAIWQNKLHLRDFREYWLEFPDLVDTLPGFLLQSGFTTRSTLYTEPQAIGKTLVQTLRLATSLNVVEDKIPRGITTLLGKPQRVHNIAPYVRGMNVTLSDAVDWEPFIKQLTTFPNTSHTDLADVMSMAVEKVSLPDAFDDPDLWKIRTARG